MAPVRGTTKAHTGKLSKLNSRALALAVYASQRGLPHYHARLASGSGLSSPGQACLPARFHRKVSELFSTSLPPFPSFLGAIPLTSPCREAPMDSPEKLPHHVQRLRNELWMNLDVSVTTQAKTLRRLDHLSDSLPLVPSPNVAVRVDNYVTNLRENSHPCPVGRVARKRNPANLFKIGFGPLNSSTGQID